MANCWNFFYSSFIHQKWCHRRVMCILLKKKSSRYPLLLRKSERSTRFKICIASVLAPFFSFTACWWLLSKHKCHDIHFWMIFCVAKECNRLIVGAKTYSQRLAKSFCWWFLQFFILIGSWKKFFNLKSMAWRKIVFSVEKLCSNESVEQKKERILIYSVVYR